MTVIIGRPIGGIALNGLEYLLDENKEPMAFENEAAARNFLANHGIALNDLDTYTYEEDK